MSYKYSGDVYAGRGGLNSCGCDDYDGRGSRGGQSDCNCYDERGSRGGQSGCSECGRDWECDEHLVLAIATVPMQKWRLTYSPEKALCAGTMFAELNLPFKGGKCR